MNPVSARSITPPRSPAGSPSGASIGTATRTCGDAIRRPASSPAETVAALPGLVHGLQRLDEAGGGGYIPPWTTLHYLFFKSPVFTGGVFLLDRSGKALWTEPPGLPWLGTRLADDPGEELADQCSRLWVALDEVAMAE